jgi:hypothetical protein
MYDSSGRAPALQVQNPEFKPQPCQKKLASLVTPIVVGSCSL